MEGRITEHPPMLPYYRHFTVHINNHNIYTILTTDQVVVRDWIINVLHHYYYNGLVVGVSAQWGPFSYYGADTFELCVGDYCLIYDLRHSFGLAPSHILRDFLHEPNITFIGLLWTELHTHQLFNSDYLGFRQGMPYDFQLTRNSNGNNVQARIWEIGRDFLGLDIHWDVMVALGHWDNMPLSLDQVYQACLTAFISFQTGFRHFQGTLVLN